MPESLQQPVREALLDAFWRYERALMSNDLDALDVLFAPGDGTIRGDAAGILVGHDAISGFRKGRGGAPARDVLHVQVIDIADDAALVIAVTAPLTGGRGQQSQLWRRVAGSWVVAAAHVSLPAPAVNSSIWRTVGTPLVAGAPTGALLGETVAVKDLFEVEGFPVGAGIPAYLAESMPATGTSPAVASLLAAGASITGIARTDEFAYSIAGRSPHYGTPPNPAVNGAVPGGSSSGPVSAVATGQASIGLGTDTAGSIRVPASYQGLWGLRSTHGAVSMDRLVALAPSFDTVGWITRDAATLLAAAGSSLDAQRQRAVEPRFVIAQALAAHVEPGVGEAFGVAVAGLEATEVDLGDIDDLFRTFRTVQAAEAWRTHGAWIEAHPGALGEDVAARFAFASTITAEQESAGRAALATARARLESVLGDSVLLVPSASSIAPSVQADAALIERTRQDTLRLTCIAGLTGRPAVSAPLLGVPQPGALLPAPVGPRFADLAVIGLADGLTPTE
ncbi:Asp-tRNA(Asn)/Glu-tRNA(Gln) amidotransferase A subunit family amidase [Salinibacterium sp. CAN_S4]|uniref:AtzH-like domain-containing protein n=1 Tax=Salinibacterium sp. CAN_S4 TaxID=2787727 RepID=UPI0018F00005